MEILMANPNDTNRVQYQIARIIYAETGAVSLRVVEALASMIANAARAKNCSVLDIVSDENMFESLDENSDRHKYLNDVPIKSRGFQMCLRVVNRMLRNILPDSCWGAVRFHRASQMPQWAIARGYIADIDGLLFYL